MLQVSCVALMVVPLLSCLGHNQNGIRPLQRSQATVYILYCKQGGTVERNDCYASPLVETGVRRFVLPQSLF